MHCTEHLFLLACLLPVAARLLESQSVGLLGMISNEGADAMQSNAERARMTRQAVAGESSSDDDDEIGSGSDTSGEWAE